MQDGGSLFKNDLARRIIKYAHQYERRDYELMKLREKWKLEMKNRELKKEIESKKWMVFFMKSLAVIWETILTLAGLPIFLIFGFFMMEIFVFVALGLHGLENQYLLDKFHLFLWKIFEPVICDFENFEIFSNDVCFSNRHVQIFIDSAYEGLSEICQK